jgi:hypothetical protein
MYKNFNLVTIIEAPIIIQQIIGIYPTKLLNIMGVVGYNDL